jgi:glycosyltransferase involved in cell wall biosynthesis
MSGGLVTPKRALFIVITDNPGGAERVAYSLAAELARRPGWEVEVKIVTAASPESFSRRLLPPGVRLSFGPYRNWLWGFPILPLRLIGRRYDFIFTTHIYTNALGSLLRRLRLIRAGRAVARESMSLFDRFRGAKARIFSILYRCYGGEELLVAQTGYMAEHVAPWLPRASAPHLRVLANPVDLEQIQKGASEPLEPGLANRLAGKRNILFCGRLVAFKQPELAIEVFRTLADEGQSNQLLFLGSGPLEERLRAEVERTGLGDDVLFLGQRTNPHSVMAACDYGLVTSANEGFPNVVLEMMACGLRKIVVTPCAGDLERLTGVEVTASFDPHVIGNALRQAIATGEDCSKTYLACVRSRSVSAYLDELLELSGESHKDSGIR